MKLNILIYSILWLAPLFANAQQGFITILDSIAVNNKTLASAKQFAEAAKTGARTGIYLDNPTVSYDWLNSPSSSFSEMLITQSFDFPTAYLHKGNIATLSAQQADENYRLAKLDVFNEAANVYTEIVSVNRKISMLTERESMMAELHIGSEKKLLAGESTIFEAGRIRSEKAKLRSEKQLLENRQAILRTKLATLNGGFAFYVTDTVYHDLYSGVRQDSTLNNIIASHPQARFWQTQSLIADDNLKLQKALGLPKFELGYRQDIINPGQMFNGIHAGISVPLFENKNTVQTAKARQLYTVKELESRTQIIQSAVMQLVSEYKATRKSVGELNTVFESLNTPTLLQKAYRVGQISYSDFFAEYTNYYQLAWYLEELKQKENELQLQLYVMITTGTSI